MNSQAVLEKNKVEISEVVDARKERFDEKKAWKLLGKAKHITTAKGRKISSFAPGRDAKSVILKNVMGPSGNLRAPCYRVREEFIVGFNADYYREWIKE